MLIYKKTKKKRKAKSTSVNKLFVSIYFPNPTVISRI